MNRMSLEKIKTLAFSTPSDAIGLIDIPYAMLDEESGDYNSCVDEFTEITAYYSIYESGANFTQQLGSNDILPSDLRYKKAASQIKKEARFLFSQTPDIVVRPKMNLDEVDEKEMVPYQDLINTVLDKNNFQDKIIKASRDCFIGKRIAILINFNESNGVQVSFIDALHFIYEMDGTGGNELKKFVVFENLNGAINSSDRRIFVKKYEKENSKVYLTEMIKDGNNNLIETLTDRSLILFDYIPAYIVLNDGLTNDKCGVSDIAEVAQFEGVYNKIANSDIDAGQKSMNPVKYTVDMSKDSTENLPTGPGAYWDLQSDQVAENSHPSVGLIAPTMNHSEPINITLKRINTAINEQLDVPDVNTESLQGIVSSGKTLKAIYWPLIVRCNEKMKTWAPALKFMATVIIEGGKKYPNTIKKYEVDKLPDTPYFIDVDVNYPLPEDETEEKQNDLSEVSANCMSRRSYIMKWQGVSAKKADEEFQKILEEQSALDGDIGEPMEQYDEDEDIDDLGIEEDDEKEIESMFDEELGTILDEEGL